MALSPKQIAARSLFANLPAYIEKSKQSISDFADGRRNPVKEQRAAEAVDKIINAFVTKMEKLCKKPLGKSIADQIDEADKRDQKKPRKSSEADDGAGF